jgi:hypothetical protein
MADREKRDDPGGIKFDPAPKFDFKSAPDFLFFIFWVYPVQ